MSMASTFCGVGIKVEKDPSRGLIYVAGIVPGELLLLLLLLLGGRDGQKNKSRDSHFLLFVVLPGGPADQCGQIELGDVLMCITNKKPHVINTLTSLEYVKRKIMGAPRSGWPFPSLYGNWQRNLIRPQAAASEYARKIFWS